MWVMKLYPDTHLISRVYYINNGMKTLIEHNYFPFIWYFPSPKYIFYGLTELRKEHSWFTARMNFSFPFISLLPLSWDCSNFKDLKKTILEPGRILPP
jgi:hypothetical protein